MVWGSVATDEENVYVFYRPSWVDVTRFYIDSAHSMRLPGGESHCLVVSYNRNTGSPVDYYVADTVNKNDSQNSLAILGDELLINVCYPYNLKTTELCKINKYTKEVTRSSPIYYNYIVECKNISVNDHGWVFRGEKGDEPRVYEKPCSPVDSLWSDGTAGHTVTLSWSSSASHPGYELAYIPETDSWDNATIVETSDTTLDVTLPNDGCHLFRVRALCDGNRVAHSAWNNSITVCPGVGIGEADGSSSISLYPNPTNDMVQILGLRDQMATVEILDMTGRLINTFDNTSTFNISTLPSGTYIECLSTHSTGACVIPQTREEIAKTIRG